MKTSIWIKLVGILIIIIGASGISQSISYALLPIVMKIGNWPELSSDLLTWGVRLGYLGILVNTFYLITGILFLLKKPFSLIVIYPALFIRILYKILPLIFLHHYSSESVINFGFNLPNLIGPAIDIILLIGVYMKSKRYYESPEESKELKGENKKVNILPKDIATFKNSITSKIVFLLTIIVFVFWILAQIIDVYRFDSVGAIFEFLWLFMLLGLFSFPILSLVFLIKEKFSFKSLYLYTIIIAVTNILLMVFVQR